MAINDKLMEELRELVAKELSDSNLAGFEQKLEEVTEDTKQAISDLIKKASELEAQLADKTVQIEALEVEKSNLLVSLESSTRELESVRAEKEELFVQVVSMQSNLESIRLDGVEKSRMEELSSLAVARKDGEALTAQTAKVRVMSNEDFASYRDELVAIRAEFGSVVVAPVSTTVAEEEAVVTTPPADLEAAREGASALPNLAGYKKAGLADLEKEFSALLVSLRGTEAESTRR